MNYDTARNADLSNRRNRLHRRRCARRARARRSRCHGTRPRQHQVSAHAARGGHPVVGNLGDPEAFRAAADAQDGYIHTAYDSRSNGGRAIEREALEAFIAAAKRPRTAGSEAPKKRFIIYTSAVWVLGSTPEPAGEDSPTNPVSLVSWRPDHEQLVIAAASARLRTVVVRPGIVYGGGHGIVGDLLKSASNGLVQ